MVRVNVFMLAVCVAAACRSGGPTSSPSNSVDDPARAVAAVADAYLAALLERRPTGGYFR